MRIEIITRKENELTQENVDALKMEEKDDEIIITTSTNEVRKFKFGDYLIGVFTFLKL